MAKIFGHFNKDNVGKSIQVPLVIRAIQIKITMRYLYRSIRMTKGKKMTIPNVNKDVEQQEHWFIVGRNAKAIQPL